MEQDLDNLTIDKPKDFLHKKAKVIMLNDDYTTMDFVIEVLVKFFNKTNNQAVDIMMLVHNKGRAVCGYYDISIAETKAEQVISYARDNEHPLTCIVEQI